MAYNEPLANKIRVALAHHSAVEEKRMMGGLTFMVNGKMCIGIIGEEMMCRINPLLQEEVLRKEGSRIMDFTGKPMKGYIMVNGQGMQNKKEFDYWISLCLEFNTIAKSAKKKGK